MEGKKIIDKFSTGIIESVVRASARSKNDYSAAMAKRYCSKVMGRVVDNAVQIHGGCGLMKDYLVERFCRDHKLLEIGEGTSEVQRIVVSRYSGC